jgi:hypothetical protein
VDGVIAPEVVIYGQEVFIVEAETIADGYQPSIAEKYKTVYLVMLFPPGERTELIRLLNG